MSGDWPLWEVFVRAKGGLAHRHVGSVHAPDAELALRHARDTYTRRQEGVSLWVIPSAAIVASDPAEAGPLFEPAERQDLPPPDLLRRARRSDAHLMPSLPAIEKMCEKRRGRRGDHGAFDAPAAGEPDPARFDYLLRLGDDALILGQRLSNGAGMRRRSRSI